MNKAVVKKKEERINTICACVEGNNGTWTSVCIYELFDTTIQKNIWLVNLIDTRLISIGIVIYILFFFTFYL